jgi:hypothetical protein
MMKSEKAWYWVAVGVLALGLSNSLADREIGWARGLVDRFQAAEDQLVASASDQTSHFLDVASRLCGRNDLQTARVQLTLARVQTRVACIRTTLAERQEAMARQEEERARAVSTDRSTFSTTSPRQKSQETLTKAHPLPDEDTI